MLVKQLHAQLVYTFKNKNIDTLKKNIIITRKLVEKLRDINYYIEITQKKPRGKSIRRLQKKRYRLGQIEIKRLKFTETQIKNALKNKPFKKPRIATLKRKKHLRKQTALLCSLEAKLPPPKIINKKLLKHWDDWTSSTMAILAGLETWVEDDVKIKKTIKEIIKENSLILKHIETRKGFDHPEKSKEWKKAITEWLAASRL